MIKVLVGIDRERVLGCSLYPGMSYDIPIDEFDVADELLTIIIKEDESKIVGIVLLEERNLYNNITSLVSYKKGVGKELMSHLVKTYDMLELDTKKDLIGYYERFGFKYRTINEHGYTRMKYVK